MNIRSVARILRTLKTGSSAPSPLSREICRDRSPRKCTYKIYTSMQMYFYIYICIYIYAYVYIYIQIHRQIQTFFYIYICTYLFIQKARYHTLYIYIHTQRSLQREREKEKQKQINRESERGRKKTTTERAAGHLEFGSMYSGLVVCVSCSFNSLSQTSLVIDWSLKLLEAWAWSSETWHSPNLNPGRDISAK